MFRPFLVEIKERFLLPWKFFAFNCYFIVIMIFIGGSSVLIKFIEIMNSTSTPGYEIAKDFTTYSLAIIAASLVDLNLSPNIQSKPSLTINSIAVCFFSLLMLYLSYSLHTYWALIPGVLSVLIALLVWVLANADNPNLSDSIYYENMRGRNVGHGNNWN